jgi:Ni/Co efflux regulator RcnB
MKKSALALLVGSAALAPLTLSAQTVPDPDPFYGIPNISLNIPTAAAAPANLPPPGVTWRQGAAAVAPRPPMAAPAPSPQVGARFYTRGGPAPMPGMHPMDGHMAMPGRPPMDGHMGMPGHPPMDGHMGMPGHPPMDGHMGMPGHPPMDGHMGMPGRPPMDGHMRMPGHPPMDGHMAMPGHRPMDGHMGLPGHHPGMDGRHAGRWQRFERGMRVPPIWWGPQFQLGNWGMYGFPEPVPGGRWIRYYDDALMLDRDGRVVDGRYGWDWDRYGDVPGYAADEGYGDADRDDYAEGEEHESGRGGDGMRHRMPPPPPGPAYGYGACGCGYGAPVLVSETIVTEPAVVEQRTYVTTVVERVRVAPRARARSKLIRRAPPPRPGERG